MQSLSDQCWNMFEALEADITKLTEKELGKLNEALFELNWQVERTQQQLYHIDEKERLRLASS